MSLSIGFNIDTSGKCPKGNISSVTLIGRLLLFDLPTSAATTCRDSSVEDSSPGVSSSLYTAFTTPRSRVVFLFIIRIITFATFTFCCSSRSPSICDYDEFADALPAPLPHHLTLRSQKYLPPYQHQHLVYDVDFV